MPFKHNAARRHRIPKARYRVQNWPTYEAGLKRRGDLTLWLDEGFCQRSRQTWRTETNSSFSLRGLEDCERTGGTTEMKQATAAGGDMLIVVLAETEEIAEFVVASAEALRRHEALEPAHTSRAPFDAAVVFLKPVVPVRAGPVHDTPAERRADRPRVGAVPVRGDPVRSNAGDRPCRAEEGLGRRHVAVLAEHRVDEIAVAVDRAIQVRPAAADLQVCLVRVPVPAAGTAPAVSAPTELVGQGRHELRLPPAGGLVAESDAA